MNFKELKIGYVPYLPDLSQPGDRRRFPYFAKRNNVPFEVADKNKVYDIILLTAPANLSRWLIYKKNHPKTRFIFEMVDSLIFDADLFNILFKGIGRYLLKKESNFYPDYKKLLIKWLTIADVIICSSTELRKIISRWNSNVIVSLDYLQNETKFLKQDYNINGKMKLVWEGQSVVLPHLLIYKEVFKRINSFCELHIITDRKYPVYGGIFKRDVETIISQLPITTIFHKWQLYNNYNELSECDCGIIPLDKKNAFGWHKPANKLISFWFTGLPTLVSDTPAYTELMNKAEEELYCSNTGEWVDRINHVKNMTPEEREAIAKRNLNFVRNNYSDAALDLIWNNIFEKISG
jgi:hypothetical protein